MCNSFILQTEKAPNFVDPELPWCSREADHSLQLTGGFWFIFRWCDSIDGNASRCVGAAAVCSFIAIEFCRVTNGREVEAALTVRLLNISISIFCLLSTRVTYVVVLWV